MQITTSNSKKIVCIHPLKMAIKLRTFGKTKSYKGQVSRIVLLKKKNKKKKVRRVFKRNFSTLLEV